MTRVERLRQKLLDMDDAALFFERTELCAEAYAKYQWEPHAIQTARIFEHVLSNMSVVIDDDLLVGRAKEIVPGEVQEQFLRENALWLVHFVLSTVIGARDFAPGRLDQYLRPLYEQDLAKGTLAEDGAQALIDCFYIKLNENIGRGGKRSLCTNSVQYLIVGGVTREGTDATNDLSYLCLSSVERLRLKQPTVIVRWHRHMPKAFFRRACEVIALGAGTPAIFNDETMIPALCSVGVELGDARDYGVIGCANPNIPGKEGALNDHRLNTVKCLELALNDGVCQMTGRDTGVRTGEPSNFECFDDLLAAFYRHSTSSSTPVR